MRKSIKPYAVFSLVLVMLAGCSVHSITSTSKIQQGNTAPVNQQTNMQSNTWNVVSRAFYTKGIVVAIDKTSNNLESITLKVEQNIKDNSPDDSPQFPFKIGSIVKVRYDQAITSKSILPDVGDEIIINIAQYVANNNMNPFWGSKLPISKIISK